MIPTTKTEFRQLCKNATARKLIVAGFRRWDTKGKLYLIPAKYYPLIPDGFSLTTISGSTMKFKKGESDNDQRFGCLSYGIVVK